MRGEEAPSLKWSRSKWISFELAAINQKRLEDGGGKRECIGNRKRDRILWQEIKEKPKEKR